MVRIVEIEDAAATQTEHPTRASLRTFIQTLLPALPLFLLAVPPVVEVILDETSRHGVTLPAWLFAALAGAAVGCALVAAVVARVMAIPEVERALRKIGLGAAPAEPGWVKDHAGAASDDVEPVAEDEEETVEPLDEEALPAVVESDAPVAVEQPDAEPGEEAGEEPDTVVNDEETDRTPPPEGYTPAH